MKNDKLIAALEEAGMSSENISDIIENYLKDGSQPSGDVPSGVSGDLKTRLLDERDWRKRAAIAARLISEDL